MSTRRRLVIALGAGALAAPFMTFAQPHPRIYRVGMLGTASQSNSATLYNAFLQGLKDLGYVEGTNVQFERRFAEGKLESLPALAAELMREKVDVIFAPSSPAVRAAKQVAGTTPIVFAVVNDPVERGFVASLAQPGGNITGITSVSPELSGKRLRLLKEAFPKTSHLAIAIAREPDVATQVAAQIAVVRKAAQSLGMEVLPIEIRSRKAYYDAADVLHKWHANAMTCLDTAANFFNREVLTEFAAKMRLPAIYTSREYADAGGLMSYGSNSEWNYREAAAYVDKILKGAKPADLPVAAPNRFELVLNPKVAKVLGFKFPDAILQKADRLVK